MYFLSMRLWTTFHYKEFISVSLSRGGGWRGRGPDVLLGYVKLELQRPFACVLDGVHALHMELDLQSLFGLLYSCTHWPRPRNPPPSPRIWAHIRGRYWLAKIDGMVHVSGYVSEYLLWWITAWLRSRVGTLQSGILTPSPRVSENKSMECMISVRMFRDNSSRHRPCWFRH